MSLPHGYMRSSSHWSEDGRDAAWRPGRPRRELLMKHRFHRADRLAGVLTSIQ